MVSPTPFRYGTAMEIDRWQMANCGWPNRWISAMLTRYYIYAADRADYLRTNHNEYGPFFPLPATQKQLTFTILTHHKHYIPSIINGWGMSSVHLACHDACVGFLRALNCGCFSYYLEPTISGPGLEVLVCV